MRPKRQGKALVAVIGTTYAVMSLLSLVVAISKIITPSSTGVNQATVTREAIAYIIVAILMGVAAARMFYLVRSGRV